MASNSIGVQFRITTFGESHGAGIGVVIDGCPAGLPIDITYIQAELDRRRPGQSAITTQRKETDIAEVLSGIYEGHTLGSPIAIWIRNADAQPKDYDQLKDSYRPSHADYTYQHKYGIRDHRGGGRASARETAARVAAGAIAKALLTKHGIAIQAYVSSIGKLKLDRDYTQLDLSLTEHSIVRCPDAAMTEQMTALIQDTRAQGDSLGGIVTAVVTGCPVGLGEPVYDKLHADLGKAMLSINAVKGFEYGSGFEGSSRYGSEENDLFTTDTKNKIITTTNHSGGIQGGISNGMDIYFNVAFKPTATIMRTQETINQSGQAVTLDPKGRHDPCVVPRAVPIVEAMAALVLADHLLRSQIARV
jgi:chorismate synthase